MGNNGLSKDDLNVILSGYRKRNLSEYVISRAEEDLKSGLSKNQVDLYAGRKLPDANVKAMSEALHMGSSAKLVRKLANMDEYRLKIVLSEVKGGMSEDKILDVLSKDATAHGMQQLFSQIKADMANTKEPDKEEARQEEDGKEEGKETVTSSQDTPYKPEDIAKAMEPVLVKFTEGLTEALKPNLEYMNRMTESMHEMQARFAGENGRDSEGRLNEELDRLEKQVKELQSDLASSAGVIKSKETEIGRLKEEMAMLKDGQRTNQTAAEMQIPAAGNAGAIPFNNNSNSGQYTSDNTAKSGTGIKDDTDTVPDTAAGKKPVLMGNCRTVLRAADGTEIPVQIERTEARRPKGMMAMAARFFGGTQPQKALLNMLIDKRLSPEQLKEIKRAKDSHFSDDELTDLIESDLPAEEMAGIIDVIMSDRKQVV